MSMTSHIQGIVPADDEYNKKLAAYRACEEAGVEIPEELDDFFGGEAPEPKGMVVNLDGFMGGKNIVKKWEDSYREGWDIDLADLPPNVKTVRFYNAY